MSRGGELHVDADRCIRCGACNVMSPGLFELGEGAASLVAGPFEERAREVEAARWLCPSDAIRGGYFERGRSAADDEEPLFERLATSAERVRWALGDLPWQDLDPELATPTLRAVVREMAYSESATYSATQRFLEEFFDDLDFSKWMSVWFYEETRHPHVLIEWLRRVGDPVSTEHQLSGRVSTPFMRSPFGTLVTNVISEMTAAQAYRRLATTSREPVLARIARHIAADEARHAATFFRFAERRLASASGDAARRDRARGVEVLQAWLGGAHATTHPVAQMIDRLQPTGGGSDPLELDHRGIQTRVVRVVGLLLDLPLTRPDEVPLVLRELLTQREKP